MRIIIIILFIFLLGCGLQSPNVPEMINLNQVGPYKYDDADLIWNYCSYPEAEPTRELCGICHWIF